MTLGVLTIGVPSWTGPHHWEKGWRNSRGNRMPGASLLWDLLPGGVPQEIRATVEADVAQVSGRNRRVSKVALGSMPSRKMEASEALTEA